MADGKLTVLSVLDLQDELRDLYYKVTATSEDEAILEARVKEIGAQLFPEGIPHPLGRDFWTLFAWQGRSSGDAVDFHRLLNDLFARLAAEAGQKHREDLGKARSQRDKNNRNMQMARQFRRLKATNPNDADTCLKEKIGRQHNLKRSAAIEAINTGMKLLKRSEK